MNCYQYLIFLLSKQDYSKFKLLKKLESKGYQTQEIQDSLEKAQSQNYLNEDNYVKTKVRQLINKGYGADYVHSYLSKEQIFIDKESLREQMENSPKDSSEDSPIQKILQKKIQSKNYFSKTDLEKLKLRASFLRFLSSKGYHFEESEILLESALQFASNDAQL